MRGCWDASRILASLFWASLRQAGILPLIDLLDTGHVITSKPTVLKLVHFHLLIKDKSDKFTMLHETMREIYHNAKMKRKKSYDEPDIDTKPMENAVLAVVSRPRELDEGKIATKLENAVPNLFTFVNHPGMEPTNNVAEQVVRSLVIHRKVQYRLVSLKGMETYSILMTCMLTWKRQGSDVTKMLRKALTAS